MFGGSMMRDMEEDPFFSMHAQHMRNMQQMFSPFGMMTHDPLTPFMALTDGSDQRARLNPRAVNTVVPHIPNAHMGFGGMFGHMNHMMANMNGMMSGMHRQAQTAQNDPNSQFFSQSTVMSYSNTGEGQPRVYQSTSSTRQAPGGVRETKKAVRDSHTGVEQLAVGRHIGERGHVMERSRNARTGDLNENEELINLDDTETGAFNNEWKERTRHYSHPSRPHHRHRSITEHSRSPYSRNPPLAIEGAPVVRRPSPQASQSERTQDHRNQHASSRTYKN